jgi:hypothetical protein
MIRKHMTLIAATGAVLAALGAGTAANATNDLHESYIDQLQKNPALIEPENQHLRYRIGDPRDGYEDRVAASRGYYNPDSGYYPAPRYGRVYVHPYGE